MSVSEGALSLGNMLRSDSSTGLSFRRNDVVSCLAQSVIPSRVSSKID
jgi:hypothetical protein